jgi:hypothetical protein
MGFKGDEFEKLPDSTKFAIFIIILLIFFIVATAMADRDPTANMESSTQSHLKIGLWN